MSEILKLYPEYGATSKLDEVRAAQYSYLDERRHVYLDYTGAGIPAKEQYLAHKKRLDSVTFGNPHSENPTSRHTTDLVAKARARVLSFVNASPDEYQVIFTPNATGAAKLVGEAYPFKAHSNLVMTSDNHNSVHGLREYARHSRARTIYVPIRSKDLRIDTATVLKSLTSKRWPFGGFSKKRHGLFAYPGQSNFSGVRHPLNWISLAQERGYDVLFDAAALLPTATLDLSTIHPDYVIISWYKIIGFPTGVGCLIARHEALSRLNRPYFSGGTVKAVTVGVPWHAMAASEGAFEDGTVNYLSIPDVHFGLDWVSNIGIDTIGRRVICLTGWFIDRLLALRHSDGSNMAIIYGPTTTESRGGTITFNFIDAAGNIVDERIVAAESSATGISLRTGCFCNPGAGESAFGLNAGSFKNLSRAIDGSYEDFLSIVNMTTGGAIRVSFGIASIARDVDYFMTFAVRAYRDRVVQVDGLRPRTNC